ncbi:ATP-binding protein [Alkalihalobacillus sp. 1P02AB]|uniref:HAMP domain-containing sensor histidine kinase n=1 Tax=Alkalihalobacillus sp. 1P02AB TaxID=3132260 RepID=UPI0039A5A762
MLNNQIKKRKSLLHLWTRNYVITLVIGLIVISVISVMWIRHTTLEHRLNMTVLLGEEIASRFVEVNGGEPEQHGDVPGYVTERNELLDLESDPTIYITSPDGTIVSVSDQQERLFRFYIPSQLIHSENTVQQLNFSEANVGSYYMVKTPILFYEQLVGWVVLIESKEVLTKVNQEYQLLLIIVISLGLLGWAAIYFLSKKFVKPIEQVAFAAKQVEQGQYDVRLPVEPVEQELHELVDSFKNMTDRLEQLESLRKELLAGVTHELKTPVTSISGLLQAVKDEVVTGEEAKEFLEISLKETNRLQHMIGDLVEFNSLHAKQFPIRTVKMEINQLINELVKQWKITQDEPVDCIVKPLDEDLFIKIDSARLQQIIVNLLNNAKHSFDKTEARIEILLRQKGNSLEIEVKDNGAGIREDEQKNIFERFFRGEEKKYKVRGLGLGLPFSKLIAQAMDGDLILKESSKKGTSFLLTLPIHK